MFRKTAYLSGVLFVIFCFSGCGLVKSEKEGVVTYQRKKTMAGISLLVGLSLTGCGVFFYWHDHQYNQKMEKRNRRLKKQGKKPKEFKRHTMTPKEWGLVTGGILFLNMAPSMLTSHVTIYKDKAVYSDPFVWFIPNSGVYNFAEIESITPETEVRKGGRRDSKNYYFVIRKHNGPVKREKVAGLVHQTETEILAALKKYQEDQIAVDQTENNKPANTEKKPVSEQQ